MIENINVRRVGNGFIVGWSTVDNEGTEEQTWDHEEEVFLEKKKASEKVDALINKL